MANLDTGSALAFVSEGSPERYALKALVSGKALIMSNTACNEFQHIIQNIGGPKEQARATRLLQRVQVVPDQPSARALTLRLTKRVGQRDIIIFGTGDALGALTLTADAKFIQGALAQGVAFMAHVHAAVPLKGV
jgi:hypothetical protein